MHKGRTEMSGGKQGASSLPLSLRASCSNGWRTVRLINVTAYIQPSSLNSPRDILSFDSMSRERR
jgi:hypothetical protein